MPTQLSIRKSLSKAFRKVTIARASFETFRRTLCDLLAGVAAKPDESEEHYKKLLSLFFEQTFYPPSRGLGDADERGEVWAMNTSDRIDLTIARQVGKGKAAMEEIGVLFEVKKPKNTAEMPTADRLNVKGLQQGLYYFLQERLTRKNVRIRHLVVTNIYGWFLFDARKLEALFVRDRQLVKEFEDFEAGRLSYRKTEEFYKYAAAPAIDRQAEQLEYTYFDLRDWVACLASEEAADRQRLIDLYKVFAPEHLYGLPFANDNNTLNQGFYAELLHILGLTECKDKNKKVIERLPAGKRDRGSLIENAIMQLDRRDKLSRLRDLDRFGTTLDERLFGVALELAITWLNRILFLKLLEAQLLAYHAGDRAYRFLTRDRLPDYDELSTLFFGVLARRRADRDGSVAGFDRVPYLNSSLFELTELEHETISIDALLNSQTIQVFGKTVLRDEADPQRKRTGAIDPLGYFLEFLDAYDFGSDGEGEIRDRSKSLISASVLGLIFEKINGYQDGSFFTPGYVTMYMCRETLRRAVVQAFNDRKGWNCCDFEALYDRIEDKREANAIINDLKICDPSVGSGHFLVSALNELIAIKSDLKILCDRDGKTLRDYSVRVENDELVVTDDDGGLFVYRPKNAESLRVQQTLFEEKRRIIEGCLFGVDINPKSVSICQLRLWIELLKNSYYTDKTLENLETLPNIDINIKSGNSVISRYQLGQELTGALQRVGFSFDEYRQAVRDYQGARSREEKAKANRMIQKIKDSCQQELSGSIPEVKQRNAMRLDLELLEGQVDLITPSKEELQKRKRKLAQLRKKLDILVQTVEDIRGGEIFLGAMEWRFEFPEVLNQDGDFVGFDVILGNPPYVRQEEIKRFKEQFKRYFSTYTGVADLFVYFYELGLRLLKPGGYLTFISSNKYFRAGYGEKLRRLLAEETTIANLIDFGDFPVFEEAIAYPSIITLRKQRPAADHGVRALSWDGSRSDDVRLFGAVLESSGLVVRQSELTPEGWRLESVGVLDLLAKLRGAGVPLGEYVGGRFYYGIKTGFNEAFVVDRVTRDRLEKEDKRSAEVLKPFLRGKDVKRWSVQFAEQYLIKIESSENKDHPWSGKEPKEAENIFKETYPAIWKFMNQYRDQLIKRCDQGKYFWELRSCKYWDEFSGLGIVYPDISIENNFAIASGEILDCTLFFIPSSLSRFLIGILNSSFNNFFFPQICPKIRGGFMRFKSIYVEQIPIPEPKKDPDRVNQIETLVQQILDRKQTNPSADVNDLETAIDQHVYQLYDLTIDEIAIIETTIKP